MNYPLTLQLPLFAKNIQSLLCILRRRGVAVQAPAPKRHEQISSSCDREFYLLLPFTLQISLRETMFKRRRGWFSEFKLYTEIGFPVLGLEFCPLLFIYLSVHRLVCDAVGSPFDLEGRGRRFSEDDGVLRTVRLQVDRRQKRSHPFRLPLI